jgi:predicted alpha/beta superfamily hydrolase
MKDVKIAGRTCYMLENNDDQSPATCFIMGVGDKKEIDFDAINNLISADKPYIIAGYQVNDWFGDMSPWQANTVLHENRFKGDGRNTLNWIVNNFLPYLRANYIISDFVISGYSLAGLFSLWAFYESGAFQGAVSCSGSLWYPKWDDYTSQKKAPENSCVYISIGDREGKAKNKPFATIGDATRHQHEILEHDENVTDTVLVYNEGTHFSPIEPRMATGFNWMLNTIAK